MAKYEAALVQLKANGNETRGLPKKSLKDALRDRKRTQKTRLR